MEFVSIMENKINIAKLLKDCPKGMELDCTMFEDVKFINVIEVDKPIICIRTGDIYRYLTQFGTWTFDDNAKCIIFPKGKTTWEGFVPPGQFKDGDILFVDCSDEEDKSYQYTFILNNPIKYGKWHSYCHLDGFTNFHSEETYLTDEEYQPRLATEEEKEKLFAAIKANGYKWNPESKTLEKLIEPKFKVGDRIQSKNFIAERTIKICEEDGYCTTVDSWIRISDQDNWELVPNKFAINTLKPFESRVLVRDSNKEKWKSNFWGFYDIDNAMNYPYECCGISFAQCIPYEGNEHLLGNTDDCDEYYKTWK